MARGSRAEPSARRQRRRAVKRADTVHMHEPAPPPLLERLLTSPEGVQFWEQGQWHWSNDWVAQSRAGSVIVGRDASAVALQTVHVRPSDHLDGYRLRPEDLRRGRLVEPATAFTGGTPLKALRIGPSRGEWQGVSDLYWRAGRPWTTIPGNLPDDEFLARIAEAADNAERAKQGRIFRCPDCGRRVPEERWFGDCCMGCAPAKHGVVF